MGPLAEPSKEGTTTAEVDHTERTRREVAAARALAAIAKDALDDNVDEELSAEGIHEAGRPESRARAVRFAAYLVARDRIGDAIELVWLEPPFPEGIDRPDDSPERIK